MDYSIHNAPYLADALIFLILLVIAGQQEAPVSAGTFARTQVPAHHQHIQGVAHTLQVILLHLQTTYIGL